VVWEKGEREPVVVLEGYESCLAGRGLRVQIGTAIMGFMALDDGRGFNVMGMRNGVKNCSSSSFPSSKLDDDGAARKNSSLPKSRPGTAGPMLITSMDVSSAARLGGGGHEAIMSTHWTEEGLGVVR